MPLFTVGEDYGQFVGGQFSLNVFEDEHGTIRFDGYFMGADPSA